MKNRLKIIVFILFLFLVAVLAVFGLSKVKVDDFHKAAVMFVIDASASNQQDLPKQLKMLKQLCSMLDPEDHVKILRVSEESYIIYEGSPQSSSSIRKAMDKFTKYDEKEYGTAYGLSLKKSFNHVRNMSKDGYIPAVVVIGDLENEGKTKNQIDWNTLPVDVQDVKNETGNFTMMFLFAAPQKLDLVKEKLGPILGEEHLIIGNEADADRSLRKFLTAIGR